MRKYEEYDKYFAENANCILAYTYCLQPTG